MQQPEIIIFCSYALSDEALQKKFEQHLRQCIGDQPKILHRGNIPFGQLVQPEIDRAIDTADLILLLVSANFLADPECQRQWERVMDQKEQAAVVIPIILRSCAWTSTRFGGLQHLPRATSPVGELDEPDLDKALTDIAKELGEVIVGISPQIPTYQEVASANSKPPSDPYPATSGSGAWSGSKDEQPWSTVSAYRQANSPPVEHPDIPDVRHGSYTNSLSEGQSLSGPVSKSAPLAGRVKLAFTDTSWKSGYVFAVDIGRSHMTCYLARMDGEIIAHQAKFPLDTATMGGERVLLSVTESLLRLASVWNVPWDLVCGISISVPGVPDSRHSKLISPPLMTKWFELNISDFLRSKLPKTDKPLPIYLNNDANMGAFGESRSVKGQIIRNLIYVKVGTGIGAGLILDGKLYRGHSGAAGEFGHILLDQEMGETLAACVSCGKRGCLESLAGARAIIEEVRKIREKGEPSKGVGLTIDDIVEAAEKGDSACRRALENAGNRIGRAIGSCLVNILNPSMIVLDGHVIRADEKGSKLLYTTLCQSAARSSLTMQGIKLDIARLGDRAIAHGAIMTVIEKYKNKRSIHF